MYHNRYCCYLPVVVFAYTDDLGVSVHMMDGLYLIDYYITDVTSAYIPLLY